MPSGHFRQESTLGTLHVIKRMQLLNLFLRVARIYKQAKFTQARVCLGRLREGLPRDRP